MKVSRMNTLTVTLRSWLATAIGIGSVAVSLHALADPIDTIIDLYRSGKTAQALSLVDERLSTSPKDPQLQLLKGVFLAEMGRSKDARAIFQALIVDHPQLPEPYNNLAVLYAAEGDYEKARTVLEMAIKTNPSYATAYENLGDIYAKLASDSYTKALNLQPRKEVQPKLRLINQVVAMTPSAGASAKAEPSTPAVTAAASATSASKTAAVARASEEKAGIDSATRDAILQAIERWRRSWSERNIQGYLDSYDPGYTPNPNVTREQWINERTNRIVPRKFIEVSIDNLRLEPGDNDTVIARFTQHYRSDILENRTKKELVFSRRNGAWLIVSERSR